MDKVAATKMASNKRKQDEKHLKTLREMVALPINKQCFDCHQRGPTYVNMSIGSFVCTSCSGILRGLNPPHRVKSISMASFTPEEMDFLKSHGNELNRKVYLGLYDSRSWPEPDSRDEQRVRDYMVQKYENKRWFVAPTEAMKEDAKRANEAALVSKPQAKPLRSMLGENASRLVSQAPASSQTNSSLQPPPVKAVSSPSLTTPQATAATSNTAPAPLPAAAAKKSDGFDLLGELGGDPFASNTPAAPVTNNATGGFADFSNFGGFNSATPSQPPPSLLQHQQQQPPPQSSIPPNPAFPLSNTPLVPMGSNAPTVTPTPASATAGAQNKNQISSSPAFSVGDRYAALADLDSAFSAPTTTATSINWGSDLGAGGALNWGGSSTAPANPTSQNSSSLGWGSNGGGGGSGINWSGQAPSTGTSMGTTPVSTGFGAASTAANPFGTSQAPSFSTPAVSSNPNPFGASQTAAATAGFGVAPPAAAPFQSQAGGFGHQFPPMQNGGFGMTPASTAAFGTTGSVPGIGAFPGQHQPQQQQFMMQQQQLQQVPAAGMGGWGAMGTPMGTQQPASANPFMSAAMQQQHVPPPSGATNPFL